jgi:hypothetical protein
LRSCFHYVTQRFGGERIMFEEDEDYEDEDWDEEEDFEEEEW